MVIKPARVEEFTQEAEFAFAHKSIYVEIEVVTNMPWAMIAVIHRRESDANFDTYLGNGQSLARPTTEVPKGRGPFIGPNSFVAGGIDEIGRAHV